MTAVAYSGTRKQVAGTISSGEKGIENLPVLDVANDTLVHIHVACKNVIKLDVGSPSDPMCVMFVPSNGKNQEIARTEVIWNDPNPQWVKYFQALYVFETQQPLHFEVYDVDSEKGALNHHDLVGYADTDLQTLISNPGETVIELKHPTAHNKRGTLIITAEQAPACGHILNCNASCLRLKRMHLFSRNNPFLMISKPSESGRSIPVFKTEVFPKVFQCHWRPFSIPLQALFGTSTDTPIDISIMDYNSKKASELIGSTQMTIDQLRSNQAQQINIFDSKRKPAGSIVFHTIEVVRKPTFYDYLRSGLQLNLITAIDFTASNRDPSDPRSLHHIQPGSFNQYEQCILSVGSIVCPYDTDQLFPVYGFGGKVGGQVNHCFPLTFDPANPNVCGLQGILQAYRNSLMNVTLSGPTLFAPVIKAATDVAIASFNESHTYTILMILTDGIINDMRQTIDAVVAATDAPLSIIIVGVGNANFDSMDQLDADDTPLRSSTGVLMKRDIVQFVPFNKYNSNNGVSLASEVLAEVPRQVDQFCSTHGFIPQF